MPRHVDHEARRRSIAKAAFELMAEGGVDKVSFRAIADRLGGSTTMVTHYYGTIQDLVTDMAERSLVSWGSELATLHNGVTSPLTRLEMLLIWLLPTTRAGMREERARIHLLSRQIVTQDFRESFALWDETSRQLLHQHVVGLVSAADVDDVVEALDVIINGIVLSALERPGKWPKKRQLATLQRLIDPLNISDDSERLDLLRDYR